MFGRKKSSPAETTATTEHAFREGAKNRPTPKRKDQEAARKQPFLATSTGDGSKAALKQKRRADYAKARAAMVSGDQKNLPPHEAGPIRRTIRDTVDARYNMGELLVPLMMVMLLATFFLPRQYTAVGMIVVYSLILFAIWDCLRLWRRTRVQLVAAFGEERVRSERGLGMYLARRSFQLRRLRLPKPQVERTFR